MLKYIIYSGDELLFVSFLWYNYIGDSMSSQKGSLKDRIRFWKQMKNRKRKEEWNLFLTEKKRQGIYINTNTKKYGFLHVFLHSILGMFLSLFEPTEKKITEKQLVQSFQLLQKQIEENPEKDKLPFYYKKIEKQEQLLREYQKQAKEQLSFDSIKNYEIKLQKMKESLTQVETLQAVQQPTFKPKNIVKTNQKTNIEPKQTMEETKNNLSTKQKGKQLEMKSAQQQVHSIKWESREEKKVESIINVKESSLTKEKTVGDYVSKTSSYHQYVLDMNKELKKQTKKIKEVEESISQTRTINELYQLQTSLLWLKNQLFKLEKEYKEIAGQKEFLNLKKQTQYYQIDQNNLLKNKDSVHELVMECERLLDKIAIKEKAISNPTIQVEKEEKVKTIEQEKKSKPYFGIEDFQQLQLQIQMDIKRQFLEIEELKITSVHNQLNGFFGKIFQFVSKTAFFITPIVFFKNRLIGTLTSSILIHNRVRSLRKVIEQKEVLYETGENLYTNIRSRKDCLKQIHLNLNNSLVELAQAKRSFIVKYGGLYPLETELMLKQFQNLEMEIMEKIEYVQVNQNQLKQIKQKYQKTLRK